MQSNPSIQWIVMSVLLTSCAAKESVTEIPTISQLNAIEKGKLFSDRGHIGKQICKDGSLHIDWNEKSSNGDMIQKRNLVEGTMVGYLEKSSPDGTHLQFRVQGYFTPPVFDNIKQVSMEGRLIEVGVLHWDAVDEWRLCVE